MAVSARRSRRLLRLCDVGAALREMFVCGGEEWALHCREGRDEAADTPPRGVGPAAAPWPRTRRCQPGVGAAPASPGSQMCPGAV